MAVSIISSCTLYFRYFNRCAFDKLRLDVRLWKVRALCEQIQLNSVLSLLIFVV